MRITVNHQNTALYFTATNSNNIILQVDRISQFGGCDLKRAVYKLMSEFLGHNGVNLNWCGTRGKLGLGQFKIANAIKGTCVPVHVEYNNVGNICPL